MRPRDLINFEIQKDYQNEAKFNGVYSRNNLPKINDLVYVRKLDEYETPHQMAFYMNGNTERAYYDAIYFDSFVAIYIQKKIRKFVGHKNIIADIDRI